MSDIISNIKIQKPLLISNRRVSLQQNPNTENAVNNNQISTNFLLSNKSLLSIKNNELASVEPLSSFYKPTKNHEMMLKSSLKTQRNTPTTSKTVRFNMPLVQVLHFYSSAMEEDEKEDYFYDEEEEEEEEENEGDYYADEQDEEEENELEDAFLELFSKRLSTSTTTYDPSPYYQTMLDSSSLDNNLVLELPNWPAKNSLKQSVTTPMVSLENLSWENSRSIIKGRVLVRNVAFEKIVTIRMSFNHWQTCIDVDARYEETSEDFDRFVFELVTPNHLSYMNLINSDSHCSLAVRYQVNGIEYWDNNSGKNFSLQWSSSPCGYSDLIGEKSQNVNSMMNTITSSISIPVTTTSNTNSAVASDSFTKTTGRNKVFSLFQQGKYPTESMAFYQENGMKYQKEEYYATIITDGHPAYDNVYIAPPLNINEKQDMYDFAFGAPNHHQIDVQFQLYLDQKHFDQERHYDYPRICSVVNHDIKPKPSSLTPSSPLLIPPGRTQRILT